MSFPVMLNSTNKVDANNYKVSLASNMNLTDYEVAVENLFIYNSWCTISAALNNNKFNLIFPYGISVNQYIINITLPDGQYNISDLNKYLQLIMIGHNVYLIDNNGNNVFYAEFYIQPGSYQVAFRTTQVPTSLPTNWKYGVNNTTWGFSIINVLPGNAGCHFQLQTLSNNSFNDIIGFANTYFPSSYYLPSNYYTVSVSSKVPNVNPISSIQMRLNCVYNEFATDSRLVHCFTNNNALFGEMIDASPNSPTFIPCSNNSFKEIIASFYDQNGNNLNILDSNLLIKLLFKKASS